MTLEERERLRALAEKANSGVRNERGHFINANEVAPYWREFRDTVTADVALKLLDALDAAERRAEEAEDALEGARKQSAAWKPGVQRAEAAEAENRRLREALDVIATCPAEAVHLMPLAAQAALAGEVPRGG